MGIHNYLWSKIKMHNISYWIGGTDKEQEGKWRWTDGSAWDFTQWPTKLHKEPNNFKGREHCLLMTAWSKKGWTDRNCDSSARFICSRSICPYPDIATDTETETDTGTDADTNTKVNSSRTKSDSDISNNKDDKNNSSNPTTNTKNGNDNNNNHTISAVAVGAPVGLILVVVVFAIIGCQACKRTKSREEDMDADENPVYGI